MMAVETEQRPYGKGQQNSEPQIRSRNLDKNHVDGTRL